MMDEAKIQTIARNFEKFSLKLAKVEQNLKKSLITNNTDIPDFNPRRGSGKSFYVSNHFLIPNYRGCFTNLSREEKRGAELLSYILLTNASKQKTPQKSIHDIVTPVNPQLASEIEEFQKKIAEDDTANIKTTLATHRVRGSSSEIILKYIPESYSSRQARSSIKISGNHQDLFYKLVEALTNILDRDKTSKRFKYSVMHERTHAFIHHNLSDISWTEKPYLKAIDEGACQSVSYIGTGKTSSFDSYRESGQPVHVLEFSKLVFLQEAASSDNPIVTIREKAVKSIRMAFNQRNLDLVTALTGNRDDEVHYIIKDGLLAMERVIFLSSYALYLLGHLDKKDIENWSLRHDLKAGINPETGEIEKDVGYKELKDLLEGNLQNTRPYWFKDNINMIFSLLRGMRNTVRENSDTYDTEREAVIHETEIHEIKEKWRELKRDYDNETQQLGKIDTSGTGGLDKGMFLWYQNYVNTRHKNIGNWSSRRRNKFLAQKQQIEENDTDDKKIFEKYPLAERILDSEDGIKEINPGKKLDEILERYERSLKKIIKQHKQIIEVLQEIHDSEYHVIPSLVKNYTPSKEYKYFAEEFEQETKKDVRVAKEVLKNTERALEKLQDVRSESKQIQGKMIALESIKSD